METHQAYVATDNGAKCTKCDGLIETGEECVLLVPAEIGEYGSANATAKAFHGVLHIECFKSL